MTAVERFCENCGKKIETGGIAYLYEFTETLYFCSEECLNEMFIPRRMTKKQLKEFLKERKKEVK